MEQNKLKQILNESNVEVLDEMPWVQECCEIPEGFQISESDFLSYPIMEIFRKNSSGNVAVEPRYIFGRNQDSSEIYVFDKMVKRENEEFYIPMTHVGRAFKVGLHSINADKINHIESLC